MPIIPIDPANAVSNVRAFFVFRLLKLKESAVRKDMEAFPIFLCSGASISSSRITYSSLSEIIFPSFRFTMRVAYSCANSGLWVTITTRRSRATSFSNSMTCTLVSLSSAPVGSSARRISGSLTSALAMATLCIWPPESWFGFLWTCSPSPTGASACLALLLLSALPMPEIVRASSTFARIVWCGIRL